MSWPDDGLPRFAVADSATVCVLDRAYAFKLVREFKPHGYGHAHQQCLARAEALCEKPNREDEVAA